MKKGIHILHKMAMVAASKGENYLASRCMDNGLANGARFHGSATRVAANEECLFWLLEEETCSGEGEAHSGCSCCRRWVSGEG
jgi:hypothetical protein